MVERKKAAKNFAEVKPTSWKGQRLVHMFSWARDAATARDRKIAGSAAESSEPHPRKTCPPSIHSKQNSIIRKTARGAERDSSEAELRNPLMNPLAGSFFRTVRSEQIHTIRHPF